MTNPITALADAARRALVVLRNMSRWQISAEPLRNDAMHVVPDLDEALAAYDAAQAQPAPSDEEIEAAINGLVVAWRSKCATSEHVASAWTGIRSLIARLRGGGHA